LAAWYDKPDILTERNVMRTFLFGLALACAACCIPGAAVLTQPARATTLVVSNNSDIVNGNTSSPAALIANPGPDGISLREALLAANNAPGPHTITFAQALAGQTIVLSASFAPITRDQITIAGLTNNGQPNITIDASQSTGTGCTLFIAASQFSMNGLRFTFAPPTCAAIQIGGAGGPISAPPHMSGIQINGNAFSANNSVGGFAIFVSTTVNTTNGATIKGVVISNNTFNQLNESINVQVGGNNNLIEDVVICGNTFSNNTFPGTSAVEVGGTKGTNNLIQRVKVLQNTFTGNFQGVVLNINQSTSGDLIQDTLIARNVFGGNLQAIAVVAGVDPVTTSNVVANTQIVDNLVHLTGFNGQGSGTIQIIDNQNGGTNNKVTGVSFTNNTIDSNGSPGPSGAGVWVTSSGGVTGVTVTNAIFWGMSTDAVKGVTPGQVSYSIINQSGFAGVNHNIGSDPMFVNPSQGDFHLQPGSPAIGAGTGAGAPFGDLECKVRAAPPAIGAYEPGNQPSCTQIVPVAAVLPGSRSVQVGIAASAFGVIINTGNAVAKACGLAPGTSLPASFNFQTTDPATNTLTGTPNTPVDVNPGALQTFVFGIVPSAAFAPTDVALEFTCANTLDAPAYVGTNTLLLSASTTPVPDLIAIGATPSNDGIVNIPGTAGTGLFATAAVNIGAAATITASADDGGAGLPVNLSICQTNPSTGQCTNPATPGPSATVAVANNQTVTFTVFAKGAGTVPFDPANNRLFLRLKDAGALTRGATGAAVRTQ
jgi:hypothetical protein